MAAIPFKLIHFAKKFHCCKCWWDWSFTLDNALLSVCTAWVYVCAFYIFNVCAWISILCICLSSESSSPQRPHELTSGSCSCISICLSHGENTHTSWPHGVLETFTLDRLRIEPRISSVYIYVLYCPGNGSSPSGWECWQRQHTLLLSVFLYLILL